MNTVIEKNANETQIEKTLFEGAECTLIENENTNVVGIQADNVVETDSEWINDLKAIWKQMAQDELFREAIGFASLTPISKALWWEN